MLMKTNGFVRVVLFATAVAICGAGCTKRPSEEDLARLDQATMAAEAAERKLADLRNERMALEQQLDMKKQELGQHEAERDDLQQKMNERGQ